MIIPKNVIITELRNRGLHQRADFVDKQLPDDVDPATHGGLLSTLHLDLSELTAAAANRPAATERDA
ncbi:hypothetical protein ACWKSP_01885 [Micromonosporaceae bacterium Da 78-11]